MNDNRSIFHDEWRACLYAHYEHVIRTGDTITEPTLRHVLLQAGLREDELTALHTAVDDIDMLTLVEDEPFEAVDYVDAVSEEDDSAGDVDDDVEVETFDESDDFEDDGEPPPAQLSLF